MSALVTCVGELPQAGAVRVDHVQTRPVGVVDADEGDQAPVRCPRGLLILATGGRLREAKQTCSVGLARRTEAAAWKLRPNSRWAADGVIIATVQGQPVPPPPIRAHGEDAQTADPAAGVLGERDRAPARRPGRIGRHPFRAHDAVDAAPVGTDGIDLELRSGWRLVVDRESESQPGGRPRRLVGRRVADPNQALPAAARAVGDP